MTDYPGLVFSESNSRILASIHASSDHPLLDLDSLRNLLTSAGYGQCLLAEEAMMTLVESYNASVPRLELPIGERRDAGIAVEITPDAMQAWIEVTPALGGKALDPDTLYAALDTAGVIFGIDQAVVNAACAASAASATERFVIATGLPAEDGQHARFELLAEDVRDRSPQVDAHGLIDFRDLGAIPTVSARQPLMRRIPATSGTVGRNVRLETIEPVPGRPASFTEDLLGADIADDDPNLLCALFSGQPVRCGNGVNVEPILQLRNVSMATGNVAFDGTVNIDGDVLPGMKVNTSGDIVIGGVVDGATLNAGGDIRVAGGIIAKAQVQAAGSVSARFVENAQVRAGTTIAINDTALQSDLQAGNQIIVGLKSPLRGRLAGGSSRAMMLIRAPIIGSPSSSVSTLLVGVNPVLDANYQQLQKNIEKLRAEEGNLDKVVKHLTAQGDKTGLLERAKASWQQALQAWARLLPERDALEQELALMANARIEVSVRLEGAVDMIFGRKLLHLRRNYETGVFSMAGERILFTDRCGEAKPAG